MSELMTKHEMTEEDIKLQYITPAIESAGWDKLKQIKILIMRSWTVWSAVSTMNCRLRYRKTGAGVALEQSLQCWAAREFLQAEN